MSSKLSKRTFLNIGILILINSELICLLFYCYTKTSWPKASWGKRFIWLLLQYPGKPRHESRGMNWIGGREGTPFAGLLSMACSGCSHTQPRITCPGVAPPTLVYVLPRQSLIKKISPHTFTYQSYGNILSSNLTPYYIKLTRKLTNTIGSFSIWHTDRLP